jgi:aryl carrier-like protein
VARGYLGRPALTAERFLPDPFSSTPGARLYCTGDRVRFLADGRIDFLGRTDRQLKVRGFRIEPGEVEAALCAHPAVRDAAVAARAEGTAPARLVAWVAAPRADAELAEILPGWLRGRLPEYMVPVAVVVLPSLPTTPNGKVDLAALPTPAALPGAAEHVAPRTPAEAALAVLVAELLGVERVGVHDNFFELGGDSIQSMQLVVRARAAGIALTTREVFEHQTVAELVAHAQLAEEEDATLDELASLEGEELDELLYALGQIDEGGAA